MRNTTPILRLLAATLVLGACASAGTSRALQDPAPNYLPGGSQMWLGVSSPDSLASGLNRDVLVDVMGRDYKELREDTQKELGFDPFDPTDLERAGIDRRRPLGFVLVNADHELFGVYAHVANPAAFASTLDRFARMIRGQRSVQNIGQGMVHTFGDRGKRSRVCVAVHNTFALMVLADRSKSVERMRRHCYNAATGGDKTMLGRASGFQRTMGLLRHGAHLYGFVDIRQLMGRQDALRVSDHDRDGKLRRARAQKDSDSARRFYQNVDGLGFGIDLADKTAHLDLRLALGAGAKAMPLQMAPPNATNQSRAVQTPFIDAAFRFDPKAGASWFLLALSANPLAASSYNAAAAWTYPLVVRGLDPDTDLAPHLDGTAELTAECASTLGSRCRGLLSLGLKNPEAVKAKLKAPQEDGWGVHWADVAGNRLVVGDSRRRSPAMIKNPARPVPAPASLASVVDVERAGRIRLNASLLFLPLFAFDGRRGGNYGYRVPPSIPGPEAKALEKKLSDLRVAYWKREKDHYTPWQQQQAKFQAGFGPLDLAVIPSDGHLAVSGGIAYGFGGWTGILNEAKRLSELLTKLEAAWTTHEDAHHKQVEAIIDQMNKLKAVIDKPDNP